MNLRVLLVPCASLVIVGGLCTSASIRAADHNDPNPINSIFSDVALDPGDLYDFSERHAMCCVFTN